MNPSDIFISETIKSIPTLLVTVITLGLGWFVGQRLTVYWNIQQKRRELDLATAHEFHSLYGEFFAIWKLWNSHLLTVETSDLSNTVHWGLLERASAAEGAMEAILVRLAVERDLSDAQIEVLGKFRQAFQRLRERIRSNQPLAWNSSNHPEYMAFKRLASQVAFLILPDKQAKSVDARVDALVGITSNRWEHIWFDAGDQSK